MKWDIILIAGVVLGIIALIVWLDIRRGVARIPGLKKMTWWQLLGLYLICWAAVSWVLDRLF